MSVTTNALSRPTPLDYATALRCLRHLAVLPGIEWDWQRARITGADVDGGGWGFRLPACLPAPPLLIPASRYDGPTVPALSLAGWAGSLPAAPPSFLLILIQAGNAALGHFEAGEVGRHKVIKKYMVRGNGKSQVSYLATRGKSKAGSRVRLANTVRFFEDINEKLIEWNCHPNVERILVGCPVRLGPLWHEAEPPPPFSKDDPRIQKVPFDTPKPDLNTLLHVGRQVCMGWMEGNVPFVG